MKNILLIKILSVNVLVLGSFLLLGCKSENAKSYGTVGGSTQNKRILDNMSSFAVLPATITSDKLAALQRPEYQKTIDHFICEELEKKGYVKQSADKADFIVKPKWDFSSIDNHFQATEDNAVATVDMVSLYLVAISRTNEEMLWTGTDSWQFRLSQVSENNIENSVVWAMARFPESEN